MPLGNNAVAVSDTLLIARDAHHTRIALLEDGRLAELELEDAHCRSLVGNLYRGRVTRVVPGLQAAFVDVGLERHAFLFAGEASGPGPPDPEAADPEASDPEAVDPEASDLDEPLAGAPEDGGPGLAEAAPDAHGSVEDAADTALDGEPAAHVSPPVGELLVAGQELLVQVVKDPLPGKGARLTTHVALPGRYLVLLPGRQVCGVSRRLPAEERERLGAIAAGLEPRGGGLIVRTAAAGRDGEALAADLAQLERRWEEVRGQAAAARAPALVRGELDPVLKAVRDRFTEAVETLWVDDRDTHRLVLDFVAGMAPELAGRVRLDDGSTPLFERFGVEREIERLRRARVWLPSGGYLLIHPTAALVAIDVNSGRYVGEHDLEETALATNLEAAREVVRQLRLRDLGGIVVIDFIDLVEAANRERLRAALAAELATDRAVSQMSEVGDFGLVTITRQRRRVDLEARLSELCPCCRGRGRLQAPWLLCLEVRRQALARAELAGRPLTLHAHPWITGALAGERAAVLREIEERLGTRVRLEPDATLHPEEFRIAAD